MRDEPQNKKTEEQKDLNHGMHMAYLRIIERKRKQAIEGEPKIEAIPYGANEAKQCPEGEKLINHGTAYRTLAPRRRAAFRGC